MACRGGSDPTYEVEVRSNIDAQPECTIRPSDSGTHHVELVNWSSSQVHLQVTSRSTPAGLQYGRRKTWSFDYTLDPRGKRRATPVAVQNKLSHSQTTDCNIHQLAITTSFGMAGGTKVERIPDFHLHVDCT